MTDPAADAPGSTFLDSLGPRGRRRAEPRTSIAIAGAGCALAVLGVLIVSGDTGSTDGDFNKVPGIVLSALVVAGGFFALSTAPRGPVAAAGTVAAALGVPPLMFFLTFDENGFPPYSTEGILVVSTLVWLGAYVLGPGRGRPFFLGAGLLGFWFTVLQLTEDVFDSPFAFFGAFATSVTLNPAGGDLGGGPFGPDPFDAPDPTTLGLLSLGLGVAYLLLTRYLDGRGNHGVATPFALATIPTLAVGTILMVDDLEQAGTGLLIMLVGGAFAYHGSTVVRRATSWLGGAAVALGAAVFLSDMTDDATIGGMLFIAAGIGLVAAGHALVTALREPDEMDVTFAAPQPAGVAAAAAETDPAGATTGAPPSPGTPPQEPDDSLWAPPSDDED